MEAVSPSRSAPFELTDVIRDCDLTATQSIDASSLLVYTAPDNDVHRAERDNQRRGCIRLRRLVLRRKEEGGDWDAAGPSNVTTTKNLASTLGGVSVGVNGLVFAYGAKAIAGIGAYGFVTGPFVGYNTYVGVTKGSSMTVAMMPSCRSARYSNSLKFGVGYQIPKLVTNAIDFFLHALNIKPITGEGGVAKEKTLKDITDYYPANGDATPAS